MNTNWKDKRVAVIGLGVEGISSVRYLCEKGASVTVLDERESGEIDEEIRDELRLLNVTLMTGGTSLDNLGQYETIVRSPGVRFLRKELQEASAAGVSITSQTQLFLDECPCPVIGVTGTKGKGTTASLIYEMLKKSELDAYLGGNIGLPPFSFLNKLTPQSKVVLELSSFQLHDVVTSPHIAVVLMITPEHLNYHTDMEEYVEAKRNILRFQTTKDFAVINRDYLPSHESDIVTDGKVFYVSRERDGVSQGCFVKNNAVWITMQGAEWKIIDVEKIKLLGKHNLENVCAAVMAATLAGAAKNEIESVLMSFTGLPHRLELVAEKNGVRYYDDSFSTTPETAIAAIETFSVPEILILGGSGKKSDFTELGTVIAKAKNIKAIIGIGEEWPRMKAQLQLSNFKSQIPLIEGATDMRTIVAAASKIATPGDVVLLSPACASFGMFKNYKERGELFKEEIKAL